MFVSCGPVGGSTKSPTLMTHSLNHARGWNNFAVPTRSVQANLVPPCENLGRSTPSLLLSSVWVNGQALEPSANITQMSDRPPKPGMASILPPWCTFFSAAKAIYLPVGCQVGLP